MHCPESIFVCNKWVSIWHNGNGDIQWKYRPFSERYNLLRWSLFLFRRKGGGYHIRINREGRLNFHWSNFWWRYLGGKQRAEKRWAKERAEEDAAFELQIAKARGETRDPSSLSPESEAEAQHINSKDKA